MEKFFTYSEKYNHKAWCINLSRNGLPLGLWTEGDWENRIMGRPEGFFFLKEEFCDSDGNSKYSIFDDDFIDMSFAPFDGNVSNLVSPRDTRYRIMKRTGDNRMLILTETRVYEFSPFGLMSEARNDNPIETYNCSFATSIEDKDGSVEPIIREWMKAASAMLAFFE